MGVRGFADGCTIGPHYEDYSHGICRFEDLPPCWGAVAGGVQDFDLSTQIVLGSPDMI